VTVVSLRDASGLEEQRESFATGTLTRFGALTSTINRVSYLGSMAAINVFTGWTAAGLPGCHGGCCCLF